MHSRILLFYIILLFLGCDAKTLKESEDIKNYRLEVSDQHIEIPINNNTANISSFIISYLNETDLKDKGSLFSINQFSNSLSLFSMETNSLIRSLQFEKEGENGVGNLSAVYANTLDSIFLFNQSETAFYISNENGELFSKMNFTPPVGFSLPSISTMHFSSLPAVYKGKLVFKALAPGNYRQISNETLASSALGYSVDLKSGETELLPFTFPSDYWVDFKKHYEYSQAINSDRGTIAYSFFGDHHLYLGDLNTGLSMKVLAKSNFFNDEFERLPLVGTSEDRLRYFATSQHYKGLIYDEVRKVYYRFCYPKLDNIAPKDYRDLVVYPQSFSIMVLDSELRIITEKRFDDQQYLPNNAFVGREGLYISMNHPKNESNKEDYFAFRLLKLEEAEQ